MSHIPSRHDQTQGVDNPCEYWLSWNGENGSLGYKPENSETWTNVQLPFRFVLLDQQGFSINGKESRMSTRSVKSNFCHPNYLTDLIVKWRDTGNVIASGKWGQIKADVQNVAKGARYNGHIYLMASFEGSQAMGCIKLHGSALSRWMDFFREHKKDITTHVIEISHSETLEKAVVPVFKLGAPLEQRHIDIADLRFEELHDYWRGYFQSYGAEQQADTQEPEHDCEPAQLEAKDETLDYLNQMEQKFGLEPTAPATSIESDDLPF